MIVSFGRQKNVATYHWNKNCFVSEPYFKIVLNNGFGFYILNSYKKYWYPKPYGVMHKDYWEFGINFAGWIFEIMWNKFFKIK